MENIKIIAFYLPQYHPIPENDKWWGTGFTEWTNVGKAKQYFRGHYQPKVPADLGYYDLRLKEVRQSQADLANEYGIHGFCYYHYWFDKDKQLLETPFNEVLNNGEPDFPFMLCWANQSWHSKFWNYDGVASTNLLIEQKYGGIEDYTEHFLHLLPALLDSRYIRIDGKPAFMIYQPLEFDDVTTFINTWQHLAKSNGLKGIHFIGYTNNDEKEKEVILRKGFDAINVVRMKDVFYNHRSIINRVFSSIFRRLSKRPLVINYDKVVKYFNNDRDKDVKTYPSILPNWDHTPRSGYRGNLLSNSTPENFKRHLKVVFKILTGKPKDKQICFLKSWNEWGEGNYMEPDLKYGRGYLEALKDELQELKIK